MAVNKTESTRSVELKITSSTATSAQVYRYSAASLTSIKKEANATIAGNLIKTSLPASSITLFVVK
jgi:O-glycosyl hydrolase